MDINNCKIETLEQLQLSKLPYRTIQDELRENLRTQIAAAKNTFQQLVSFEPATIQAVESALLAKQHFILFGENWHNKSLVISNIINLLDEFSPYIASSSSHEHPAFPLTQATYEQLAEHGNQLKISWLKKPDRILVIHANVDTAFDNYANFQNINRKIVIIRHLNRLRPNQQIQLIELLRGREFVGGQPVPDCLVIGTLESSGYTGAECMNPELMDCFGAFISTYYPPTIAEMRETVAEILSREACNPCLHHELSQLLHEECALLFQKEGWLGGRHALRSARMKLLLSATIEKRTLLDDTQGGAARIVDFYTLRSGVFPDKQSPSENQEEQFLGDFNQLISNAIKKVFVRYFPDPEKYRRTKQPIPYLELLHWFNAGNKVSFSAVTPIPEYQQQLTQVPGLFEFVKRHYPAVSEPEIYLFMELLLHGLADFSFLNKTVIQNTVAFQDMIGNIFRKPVDGGNCVG